MYTILYNCMSHCDIDFEKHTQFLHVKFLVKNPIQLHTYLMFLVFVKSICPVSLAI